MRIIQIVLEEWEGSDGKKRTEIIGLGDDGLVYKWNKGNGVWVLNVINK